MSRRARAGFVTGVVAIAMVATAAPAAAADTLEDYLADAENSEYAGRRIVVTSWDGESEVGIYEVTHAGDVTVIGDARVSNGKVAGGDEGVAVAAWSRRVAASRYRIVETGSVERLGRTANGVEVYEGELLRATILFDAVTGAPLITQMFDGDGDMYRYSAMLDFEDQPDLVYREMDTFGSEYDVMIPVGDTGLPSRVAGYTRTDAYRGADDWLQTFYADGLFSFSLFQAEGPVTFSEFGESTSMRVAGAEYALLLRPTEVWVMWRTDDATMVLVGDLPPDHLDDVLADLPAPERPGFLKRLWRGIFG